MTGLSEDSDSLTAEQIRFIGKHAEPRAYLEPEGVVDFNDEKLGAGYVEAEAYYGARAVLVRTCVDGLVSCLNDDRDRGILLITRKGDPAKGKLFSIGGAVPRHKVGLRDALTVIAKEECNVNLSDFVYLGGTDFGWGTNPIPEDIVIGYGGEGIRDFTSIFYAKGDGELRFTDLDNEPLIVTPKMWRDMSDDRLNSLHPHVLLNLPKALTLLESGDSGV